MHVAWFLAIPMFAAGFLASQFLHRRTRRPAPAEGSDLGAVQEAARMTQHLHATVLRLEEELSLFRQGLKLPQPAGHTDLPQNSPADPAPNDLQAEDPARPLLVHTQSLVEQLTSTRVELHEQIRQLITAADVRVDPATGLGSQREANRWMETLLALMARYGNQFSIAIATIDQLQQPGPSNEAQTNRWLQQLGQTVRQATRETDVVARYGEDELLIILPETDEAGAIVMAQRLRRLVAEQQSFTVSIGVAAALQGDSYKSLIHRADAALFAAQDQLGGGGGCCHNGIELQLLDTPSENNDGAARCSIPC